MKIEIFLTQNQFVFRPCSCRILISFVVVVYSILAVVGITKQMYSCVSTECKFVLLYIIETDHETHIVSVHTVL